MGRIQQSVLTLGLLTCGCMQGFAQTDVAFSLLGAFSESSNGNGTLQTPSVHAGGLFQLRHIANPLVGYEVTYSYSRANQVYTPVPSNIQTVAAAQPISANANQVTADWVVSLRLLNFRPFALAGVGALITRPVSDQSDTLTSTKAVTAEPMAGVYGRF